MAEKIKKPWAVYFHDTHFLMGIGRIVADNSNFVNILYSERQEYPAEAWEVNFVRRFDEVEKAMECYLEHSSEYSSAERLRNDLKKKFPRAYANSCRTNRNSRDKK